MGNEDFWAEVETRPEEELLIYLKDDLVLPWAEGSQPQSYTRARQAQWVQFQCGREVG